MTLYAYEKADIYRPSLSPPDRSNDVIVFFSVRYNRALRFLFAVRVNFNATAWIGCQYCAT